jgi:hypothetical protein
MLRHIATIGVVALALAATSGIALAGKGGGGGGNGGGGGGSSPASSSIAIATIDGVSAASTLNPAPKLGDTVTFGTTVGSLAGWEYPMIDLACFQDVNNDGVIDTNLLGPDVVFTWLDKPDATYTMGAYSSIWTLRGGGDALCRANLDAYGWKGGVESTRVLASTAQWVAAG